MLADANGNGGNSSTTHGYTIGAGSGHSNIEKYSFASDANSTSVGVVTQARRYASGTSSTTHGYCHGGHLSGTNYNVIDKFTFSADNNATDVGDLIATRYASAGIND